MPQWTLLGLLQGKQTAPWPLAEGTNGQEGFLGMPRYQPALCDNECKACADICPTKAITMRASSGTSDQLDIDYGRCIVCQLCAEACPTGAMTTSSDWAFGARSREDLIWKDWLDEKICYRRRSATCISAKPPHSPCRCRLMQRLRIRAAGIKQSVLQPASPWHLLYCLAALCRPTVGYRAGHAHHARPLTRHLRSDGGAAVGACGRHVRRLRRDRGGRLCLGSRSRWCHSGRCLSARLSTEPGGNHPSPANVS